MYLLLRNYGPFPWEWFLGSWAVTSATAYLLVILACRVAGVRLQTDGALLHQVALFPPPINFVAVYFAIAELWALR